jgi:hypothetical protein
MPFPKIGSCAHLLVLSIDFAIRQSYFILYCASQLTMANRVLVIVYIIYLSCSLIFHHYNVLEDIMKLSFKNFRMLSLD